MASKAEIIFRNRELILNALQKEANEMKDNGRKESTLKLFSRIDISKKDIISVDKRDIEKIVHGKYGEQKAKHDGENASYLESVVRTFSLEIFVLIFLV